MHQCDIISCRGSPFFLLSFLRCKSACDTFIMPDPQNCLMNVRKRQMFAINEKVILLNMSLSVSVLGICTYHGELLVPIDPEN